MCGVAICIDTQPCKLMDPRAYIGVYNCANQTDISCQMQLIIDKLNPYILAQTKQKYV